MAESQFSPSERAARIKLLLMDVDGVLTDGRVWPTLLPDGTRDETKGFNTQDGIGLQMLYRHGIVTGIVSGNKSTATARRAETAHCKYIYMGDWEKTAVMEEILADCRLPREEIAFVGDDITDVVCFRRVGFSIAVANAVAEVKDLADYVTQVPGGRGAIREVAELILKAQGKWDDVLRHYEVVV